MNARKSWGRLEYKVRRFARSEFGSNEKLCCRRGTLKRRKRESMLRSSADQRFAIEHLWLWKGISLRDTVVHFFRMKKYFGIVRYQLPQQLILLCNCTLKKKGTKKRLFFVNANRSRHFEQYLAAKPRFLDVIPSKEFCPNSFRQAFYYHSGLLLLLSRIIWTKNAPNSEDDSSEDSEVDNRLQVIHFADPVKDAKSVAGFSPSRQFRVGRYDVTWFRLAAITGLKWRPPK